MTEEGLATLKLLPATTDEIANGRGVSKSSVYSLVKALQDKGLLVRTDQRKGREPDEGATMTTMRIQRAADFGSGRRYSSPSWLSASACPADQTHEA